MIMELISIIIPVYNVEKYLKQCVESLTEQTYRNLEIILIDDGSTDLSGAICDELGKNDKRIKVIHKKNEGMSVARNVGLDVCRGQYIGFVDSDDFIDKDMFQFLYNNIQKYNADISVCRAWRVINNLKIHSDFSNNIFVVPSEEAIEKVFTDKFELAVWNKLYRKDIFNDVRFLPEIMIAEDAAILVDILKNAQIIVFQDTCKYNYRIRNNNISKKVNFNEHIFDFIDAYEYNLQQINKFYPRLQELGECLLWNSYEYVILRVYNYSNNTVFINRISELQKIIRKNIKKILSNRKISIRGKAMFLVLCANIDLYVCIYKKRHKIV
ncbi:MAG TPA: glycosyl transferase family 2 [Clostridiales bacterium]|nr:glycosyl transferase family 2 [Clostridiales bacterium]